MAVEDSKEIGDLLELREEAFVQIKVMMLIKGYFFIYYKKEVKLRNLWTKIAYCEDWKMMFTQ
jgi:hypothetical protein